MVYERWLEKLIFEEGISEGYIYFEGAFDEDSDEYENEFIKFGKELREKYEEEEYK